MNTALESNEKRTSTKPNHGVPALYGDIDSEYEQYLSPERPLNGPEVLPLRCFGPECPRCGKHTALTYKTVDNGMVALQCYRCGYGRCWVASPEISDGTAVTKEWGGHSCGWIERERTSSTFLHFSTAEEAGGFVQAVGRDREQLSAAGHSLQRNGEWLVENLLTGEEYPWSHFWFEYGPSDAAIDAGHHVGYWSRSAKYRVPETP
jgi:hypothetical protein